MTTVYFHVQNRRPTLCFWVWFVCILRFQFFLLARLLRVHFSYHWSWRKCNWYWRLKKNQTIYIIHHNSFPFQTSIGWRVKLISYLSSQNRCRNGSFEPKALQFSDTGPFSQLWAVTWQNQQNACAPSEDSDQTGWMPSLISLFAESTHILLVLSCQGSYSCSSNIC